jgi:hypothetical protein
MPRNQWNVNVTADEAEEIENFCKENDRAPQWLFKAGAMQIINEYSAERRADMLSALALQEVLDGKSEPLDDLLAEMAADRDRGRRLMEAEVSLPKAVNAR